MPSTAVSILANHFGVQEEDTNELLKVLETADCLPDDRRTALLEELVTADNFGPARRTYSAARAIPKLSEAVRLERRAHETSEATTAASYMSLAENVEFLRHGAFFKNVVKVFRVARLALSRGEGTIVYLRSKQDARDGFAHSGEVFKHTNTRLVDGDSTAPHVKVPSA